MAEKLDPKQTVDFKDPLMSEILQHEALINILDPKGIVSKQELLEEIKRVATRMPRAET